MIMTDSKTGILQWILQHIRRKCWSYNVFITGPSDILYYMVLEMKTTVGIVGKFIMKIIPKIDKITEELVKLL